MIQQTMNKEGGGPRPPGSPPRRVRAAWSGAHAQTSWSVKQYHRYSERQAAAAAAAEAGPPGRAVPPLPPPAVERPRQYAVEGTPINFSTATSLSDLTMDDLGEPEPEPQLGPAQAAHRPPPPEVPTVYATEGTPGVFSRADSLSDIVSAVQPPEDRPAAADWQRPDGAAPDASPSRTSSLSSLSMPSSDGDSETDDMLLERCISSAMPKSRSDGGPAAPPAGQHTDRTGAARSIGF
ncbi:misshapen-like kinase 1 [Pollicipes pollicipes]|uniref:misshapen-like kinase 1 n=1 Tax=Pollicipes pollicipes TaxID=41117 RepID=UPI001885367B|nr:misshapen-like kinase 1 [Pollicipes pollicipes]